MHEKTAVTIDEKVWEEYKETKSVAVRNQIVEQYLYIVTINAKRMSGMFRNKADMEDIVNQGVLALIESVDRYDWEKGVQFDSFASIRVRGAIIDYFRKQDWVSRSIRKKFMEMEDVYARLQSITGSPPSDAELAKHLSISVEELNDLRIQSQRFSMLSYEELLQETLPTMEEQVSHFQTPEEGLEEEELKEVIARSVDDLNENERLVVSLYYYNQLKLKEIAVVLGVTPSRVSQLHTKALSKMKSTLQSYLRE